MQKLNPKTIGIFTITLAAVMIGHLVTNISFMPLYYLPDSNLEIAALFAVQIILAITAISLPLWIIAKLYRHKEKRKFVKAFMMAAIVKTVHAFTMTSILILIGGSVQGGLLLGASTAGNLLGLAVMSFLTILVVKIFYKFETRKAFILGFAWTVAIITIGFLMNLIVKLLLPLTT